MKGLRIRSTAQIEAKVAADRTVTLLASTELPVARYDEGFVEMLEHTTKAVNLSRVFSDSCPLLFNHSSDALIGSVELAYLENRQLYVVAKLADTERGREVQALVNDGILRSVSIGYVVESFVSDGSQDNMPIYRATRWQVLEVSLVSMPADPTTSVGRGQELMFSRRLGVMSLPRNDAQQSVNAPALARYLDMKPGSPDHAWADPRAEKFALPIRTGRGVPPEYAALVGVNTAPGELALRPADLVGQLPLRVIEGLREDLLVPVGDATPDTTPIGGSRNVLRQVSLKPKTIGLLASATENQLRTSEVMAFIVQDLSEGVSSKLSRLLLNGLGTGTEPVGIRNTFGINRVTGATLDIALLSQLERSVLAANADPESLVWLCNPAILEQLRQVAISTDYAEPLLPRSSDSLLGHRLITTNHMPSGELLLADWSKVLVAYWNQATLLINPFGAGFWSARVQVRCLLDFDSAALRPDTVALATF